LLRKKRELINNSQKIQVFQSLLKNISLQKVSLTCSRPPVLNVLQVTVKNTASIANPIFEGRE